MISKKQIRSFVEEGLSRTKQERQLFEKEFIKVSDRIAASKKEMEERSKKRNLIQNK